MSLNLNQFDLDGYVFGGEGDNIILPPGGFDQGVVGWREQSVESPFGDFNYFGRDLLTPPTWTFTALTNKDTFATAKAAVEAMAVAWRPSLRSIPGAVSTLRYNIGQGVRRVYGRPRRFSFELPPSSWKGLIPVIADFELIDPLVYNDTLTQVTLDLPSSSGSTSTSAIINAGGSLPTPFVAIIQGPVTNPRLQGPGWQIQLNTTLSSGQSATIDTRPWAMSVLRNDGASLAGTITNVSSLLNARLQPSGPAITFAGSGSSSATVAQIGYRTAYATT